MAMHSQCCIASLFAIALQLNEDAATLSGSHVQRPPALQLLAKREQHVRLVHRAVSMAHHHDSHTRFTQRRQ